MHFLNAIMDINYQLIISKTAPVILKFILLFIAFFLFSPLGKRIISKIISNAAKSEKISTSRMKTLEKLLINLFSYTMFFLLIMMSFDILSIPIAPLLAGAGILGLAIGFGAQGIVSDVVTGFFILLERQLEIDDYVTIATFEGIVEEVGLRTTKIRGFDGTLTYIPNRNIINVANHSRGNMRALVDFNISNDKNIDESIAILEKVCLAFQLDPRFKTGPNVLGVQGLTSSETILRIVGQTENGMQWSCERDLRKAIKAEMDLSFSADAL